MRLRGGAADAMWATKVGRASGAGVGHTPLGRASLRSLVGRSVAYCKPSCLIGRVLASRGDFDGSAIVATTGQCK